MKKQFLDLLLSQEVLKFGSFVTKSGRPSPYFFNTGRFRSGAVMTQVATCYAQLIDQTFQQNFDNLFGPAYKGIPLSVATSMVLSDRQKRDVSFTFNRKEKKGHGEGGNFVG